MESLLRAKSTAPKSQRVNYKKASGIPIYAKLRNIQINVEYSMSDRYGTIYFYLLNDLSRNCCISVHPWNRLWLSTINTTTGKRGLFLCMLHTFKICIRSRESGRRKVSVCELLYFGKKRKNIFLNLKIKYKCKDRRNLRKII